MIVVDDHTLLGVLAGEADGDLNLMAEAGEVFTTSIWYYRLARAVRDSQFVGQLSRHIGALPLDLRRRVVEALDDLPPEIGLLSARVLVPVMAGLTEFGRLNLLNAEAIASAVILQGRLRVVAAAPVLHSTCELLSIELEVHASA